MANFSVYEIINLIDGSIYVGQSHNPHRRWRQHLTSARSGKDLPLYAAIRKYGAKAFRLDIRATFETREEASELEVFLIEEHEAYRYNIYRVGYTEKRSWLSLKPRRKEELRQKYAALMYSKNTSLTAEERRALAKHARACGVTQLTPEQRSEITKRSQATIGAEKRSKIAKKRQSAIPIEKRSEIAKARAKNMNNETKAQLAAFRSTRMKDIYANLSLEERTALAMKAQASRSPELKRRISEAAIAARKRNAELRRRGLLPPTAPRKDQGIKRTPLVP